MDLKIILEKHKKWLETRDSDEVAGERADLSGAAIGVNRYTGKMMPRKKKNLPAATGQAQVIKK